MDESQDSAAFIAECVTVSPSRAEYVQQVMRTARETLARSRGNDQVRERASEPLGAPEWRSRERPLAARDRTSSPATPAPQPDTQVPTWEQERDAVFEAICALRELCEALDDRFVQLQKGPWHAAYRAMAKWGDAGCARIEKESLQQQREEEPLELPPLHSLRESQN